MGNRRRQSKSKIGGGVSQSASLKELQSQMTALKAKNDAVSKEQKHVSERKVLISNQMNAIQQQIEKLGADSKNQGKVVITEHAIIRYLERVKGINMNEIKAEMVPDESKKSILELGGGRFPVNNKYILIVKKGYVVSVVEPDGGS